MNAKRDHLVSDNEGSATVFGHRVTISMLALQDLLTGRTPFETFVARHRFIAEHLARLAERGQCIADARAFKDERGRDDDRIELDFSGTDPRHIRPLVDREGE